MNKEQAIQDAKKNTEKTGMVWLAIRIRTKCFLWVFCKYTYETVSEYHLISHAMSYWSGKFKKVYICKPEVETELDY